MDLLKPRTSLAFGHMEVRIDDEASEVSDQITYLYKCVLKSIVSGAC
jgi:DNA mismatch repair protein MSH5